MSSIRLQLAVLSVALLFQAGCGDSPSHTVVSTPPPDYSYGGYDIIPANIQFNDAPKSSASSDGGLEQLAFVDVHGKPVEIKNLLGKKNLVVVVTRGNTNPICVYCSTQTSRLISNYAEFAKRNAEVVVVYPVQTQADTKKLDDFLAATRKQLAEPDSDVPFPILLDVELKSVEQLGIRNNLSNPATYILDTQGQVRFAYVGSTIADRPSIKALLGQLDALSGGTTETDAETQE